MKRPCRRGLRVGVRVGAGRGGGLRTRIVLTSAGVSTVATFALVALVVLLTDNSTDREIVAELNTRIAAVQSAAVETDGRVTVTTENDALFDTLTWVYDTEGRRVAGPAVPEVLEKTVARLARAAEPQQVEPQQGEQQRYELKGAPIRIDRTRVGTAVAAIDVAPSQGVLRRAATASAALGLAVIVGMTLLSALIVRRALAPVAAMAATADSWSQERLDQRFDLGAPRDEITGLGAVLDGLLERVGVSIRAEQRLTAELAHELRTPLTVVQGEAQLGASLSEGADRARFERIAAAAAEMGTATTLLLDVARGRIGADARADVVAAARSVLDRKHRADVDVRVRSAPSSVAVPRELVERILIPVLDNAFRYAVTRVEVAIESDATEVRVSIANDGPPVDVPGDDLFDPGVRGADSPGAGLGLALARRLARTAGGDIALTSAEHPVFVVTMPSMKPSL